MGVWGWHLRRQTRAKKAHFRRETLKKPPGLIFKSAPSEGKGGEGEQMKEENERGRGLGPKMGKHEDVERSERGRWERYES